MSAKTHFVPRAGYLLEVNGMTSYLVFVTTCTALVCCQAKAQSLVPSDVAQVTSYNFAHQRVPFWNGFGATAIEKDQTMTPLVHVFDRYGNESQPAVVSVQGASVVAISAAACEPDGTVVA